MNIHREATDKFEGDKGGLEIEATGWGDIWGEDSGSIVDGIGSVVGW